MNRDDGMRGIPYVARFFWADLWPNSDVLAFADPSAHLDTRLSGA